MHTSPQRGPTPKTEPARNEDLPAANRAATAGPLGGGAEPPPHVSAASAPAPAATEHETSGGSRPNTVAASVPKGDLPTSNTPAPNAKADSTPQKPDTAATAQLSRPGGQTMPIQNGATGSAPAQTPSLARATRPSESPNSQPLPTYRPPRPVKEVLPKISALPQGTADATGELKVLVKVDESGLVIDARVDGNKRIDPTLRDAALGAARQWVFEPASLHGKSIASDHTILFQFRQ